MSFTTWFFSIWIVLTIIGMVVGMFIGDSVFILGAPVNMWTLQLSSWSFMFSWYTFWALKFEHVCNPDQMREIMGDDFVRRTWR